MVWLFIRVDSQQPLMGIFLPAFGASACRGSMEREWREEGGKEGAKNFLEMCLQMRVHLMPNQKFEILFQMESDLSFDVNNLEFVTVK